MESKIIEYGITLLHKSKVEKTEVMSRLTFTFLLTNYNNLWSDLHFPNTFSFFFVSYDITSLENIHPIAFWKYTKHPTNQSVVKITKCFLKNMYTLTYPRFPGKSKNRLNLSLLPSRTFASSQQFFFSVRLLIQSETSTKQLLLEYR